MKDDGAATESDIQAAVEDYERLVRDTGKAVIEAVREILTSAPMPVDGADAEISETDGHLGVLPHLRKLIQEPTGQSQYQALALVAACVRWLSAETGRAESEILDGLAENYRRLAPDEP